MFFISIAILSYFFTALATVFDKFLISSKRIAHPAVYTFYLGFFSIFTLPLFFPFGFRLINFSEAVPIFFLSSFYTFGILLLLFTYRKNEASRVIPVVGVFTTLTSFLISSTFLGESLDSRHILGIILLILGGLFISFKFKKSEIVGLFQGFTFSLLSGIFLGIAFSSFKYFYSQDNFFNVFIWTRIGVFISAMALLFVSGWRKSIGKDLRKFRNRKSRKKQTKTGFLFVGNKILGGIGSILANLAIASGSVAIVNALVATEYVFIFAISFLLAFKFPKIFKEGRDWKIALQKILSILIIGLGVWLVK